MTFFSHRGNIDGPNPARENEPSYIDIALACGFSVEIDLRCVNATLFLGHDYPQHAVDIGWLVKRHDHLLIHIKDFQALNWLSMRGHYANMHCFCHGSDLFTVTSWGFVWLHDINATTGHLCQNVIVPLISKEAVTAYAPTDLRGVCSDFVSEAKLKFS